MENERIINIGPVCRFGPGGEYITAWPAGSEIVKSAGLANQEGLAKNALSRVLNVLGGMIDALRGSKAVTRDSELVTRDSEFVTRILNDEQMMLFDDDLQANQIVRFKAHHRIRATAKKRACITFVETGTLFDANNEIAKTA